MNTVELEGGGDDLPVLHLDPQRRDMSGFDNKSFTSQLDYLNFTGEDITVLDRRGFVVQLKSIDPSLMNTNTRMYERGLYIRVRYSGNEVAIKGMSVRDTSQLGDTSEKFRIKDSLDEQITEHQNLRFGRGRQHFYAATIYKVDLDMFHKHGGGVYIPVFDIVACLGGEMRFVHPYSPEGRAVETTKELQRTTEQASLSAGYRIIDNHELIGDKYMKVGNEVYFINAEKHASMPDGIYRYESGRTCERGKKPSKNKLRILIAAKDEPGLGERYGLWSTYDEAKRSMSLGDQAKMRELADIEESKQRNIALERELQDVRAESARRKVEHDNFVVESERERLERQEAIDQENHARELEKNSARDYYDQRAASRRDWTEVLKYLGAAITAIGAIAIVVRNWMAMTAKQGLTKGLLCCLSLVL